MIEVETITSPTPVKNELDLVMEMAVQKTSGVIIAGPQAGEVYRDNGFTVEEETANTNDGKQVEGMVPVADLVAVQDELEAARQNFEYERDRWKKCLDVTAKVCKERLDELEAVKAELATAKANSGVAESQIPSRSTAKQDDLLRVENDLAITKSVLVEAQTEVIKAKEELAVLQGVENELAIARKEVERLGEMRHLAKAELATVKEELAQLSNQYRVVRDDLINEKRNFGKLQNRLQLAQKEIESAQTGLSLSRKEIENLRSIIAAGPTQTAQMGDCDTEKAKLKKDLADVLSKLAETSFAAEVGRYYQSIRGAVSSAKVKRFTSGLAGDVNLEQDLMDALRKMDFNGRLVKTHTAKGRLNAARGAQSRFEEAVKCLNDLLTGAKADVTQ